MEKKFKVVGKLETNHNTLTVSVKKHQARRKMINSRKNDSFHQNKPSTSSTSISPAKLPATSTKMNKTGGIFKKPAEAIREFKCLLCNISFYSRNLLLRHLNSTHSVPLLSCNLCGDQFADLVYLNRHKRNVHENRIEEPQIETIHEELAEEMYNNTDTDDCAEDFEDIKPNEKFQNQSNKSLKTLKKEEVIEDVIEYEDYDEPDNSAEDSWWDHQEQNSPEPVLQVPKTKKKSAKRRETTEEKGTKDRVTTMFGKKRGRPTEEMISEWKKRRTEFKTEYDDSPQEHSIVQVKEEVPEKKRRTRTSKKEPKEYSGMCYICGEIKVCLAAHIRKVHTESSTCPHCCGKIVEGDPKPHQCSKKRLSYRCTCGEEFIIKEQIHAHLLDKNSPEHNAQCWHCEASFGDFQHYLEHQDVAHPAPFTCDICQKGFYKKPHLQMHVYYIHMIEKEIKKCNVCGADCAGERSLKRHISRVHRNAGRVTCEICNLSCYDKHTLKRHMANKHIANKKFICDVCKKDFSTPDALKYHFTIHTGDRPFPCPFCPKSFKVNSELRKHYRAHKELTVKCPSCNLYCLNEEDLRKHFRRFPSHDIANSVYVMEEIE